MLGDASNAAPFTSKFPSIRSVYDIIRQGRCTLVTSVQNNQIMVLTSLISSYSLSVLYLDGIKFSDYQMTATGLLLTVSHLAVSHVSPLKEISGVRPLTSMFSPALFFEPLWAVCDPPYLYDPCRAGRKDVHGSEFQARD